MPSGLWRRQDCSRVAYLSVRDITLIGVCPAIWPCERLVRMRIDTDFRGDEATHRVKKCSSDMRESASIPLVGGPIQPGAVCGTLADMPAAHNTVSRKRIQILFGVLLCSLVLLFSTGVKLAAYRDAPAANQIKSMKMSSKSVAPSTEATAQMQVVLASVLLFALLCLGFPSASFVARRDEVLPPIDRWFSLALAVRPPPSI